MATPDFSQELDEIKSLPAKVVSFEIKGLFGIAKPIKLTFPDPQDGAVGPAILIISGENGTGKTTLLRMISGMLELVFDEFRRIPFEEATLRLSGDRKLTVKWLGNNEYPLLVTFDKHQANLAMVRSSPNYTPVHQAQIDTFRNSAKQFLRSIHFDLIELDRSPPRKPALESEHSLRFVNPGWVLPKQKEKTENALSKRVATFLSEAQVDYHRFFRTDEIEFLPKLLQRLDADTKPATPASLSSRIAKIHARIPTMIRYGLFADETQLASLEGIIKSKKYKDPKQYALLETYIEMQEGAQKARDLIARRLEQFENIYRRLFPW